MAGAKTKKQSPCPHAKKCGGCQLMNMTYDEQLSWKTAKCIKLLGKFCRVNDIIGMENPIHYRNKVQAAFQLTRSGKIVSGVYQAGTHNVVNVDSCLTEDETADRIIVFIRSILPEFKILPYNEDSGRGFLRHVLVKRGFSTDEIMVVLVGANPRFPMKNRIAEKIVNTFPQVTTVVFNINPHKTSMLLGERSEVLYGSGYIEDELCGCRFRISPKSFYQINPAQTEILYRTAVEFAEAQGKTVIDAYCGTGTIGIVAAKTAKSVIGVELNGDAVRDAVSNAKANGVKNIRFVKADAGEFMRETAKSGGKADVVFMDPPRAGSDIKFLSSLVKLAPERVVYISCNPETLARDLAFLTKEGYRVKKIQPVDMFPFTNHVETVVRLSRSDMNS
ncbi:MAG: 23S rRNA (uracil(1939)-C(5))-methyltransferase RlmD [Clostridia bacterium]|nr:23S rRNA (uracil(1939)-C(5))-methyltransferase RlmD [Clostridia bacterium]